MKWPYRSVAHRSALLVGFRLEQSSPGASLCHRLDELRIEVRVAVRDLDDDFLVEHSAGEATAAATCGFPPARMRAYATEAVISTIASTTSASTNASMATGPPSWGTAAILRQV